MKDDIINSYDYSFGCSGCGGSGACKGCKYICLNCRPGPI